jgi:predicted  nucleic acid-binding Zn-ribbon protein
MKKCAKCGAEYDDAYDGCPECAKKALKPKVTGKQMAIGCALLLVVLAGLAIGMNSCFSSVASSAPKDNPTLAVKANLALGAALAPYVDTVTANSAGAVIVTLNQTSAAIAGDAGANGAAKVGGGIGSLVLNAVPEATSVAVFDADNKMLEISTRK